MSAGDAITAASIRALLKQHLSPAEWGLAFEVTFNNRRADAVAVNYWPSRGNPLHGYEFKVSRADWRAELKKPGKADEICKHCDYWWVVTSPKVIKAGELPETWGHMEVVDNKLVVVKEATKKSNVPLDRSFMASLFRRLSIVDSIDFNAAVEMQRDIIRNEYALSAADQAKKHAQKLEEVRNRAKAEHQHLYERIAEFEKITGLSLESLSGYGDELGRAVSFVLHCKLYGSWSSVEHLRKQIRASLDVLDQAFANYPPLTDNQE
jgi:hypothetical protein